MVRRLPITHRSQTSSGYCVGSSRRQSVSTSSAFAAAITKIAAVPSAARAVDHSAAASPTFGDSVEIELSRHNTRRALARSVPLPQGETTSAVEFLRFAASPATVSDTHIERFSGAM
jgi:CCR4-NOT transcriptional regulation complex NOT5 subunit